MNSNFLSKVNQGDLKGKGYVLSGGDHDIKWKIVEEDGIQILTPINE